MASKKEYDVKYMKENYKPMILKKEVYRKLRLFFRDHKNLNSLGDAVDYLLNRVEILESENKSLKELFEEEKKKSALPPIPAYPSKSKAGGFYGV